MNIILLIINFLYILVKFIFGYLNYNNLVIKILTYLSEYNIIFVKIFQWTWINNNFLTPQIQNLIYSFGNNTPYIDNDINYKDLLDIYDIANKEKYIFEIDNLKPINSGTISLVFKGKLNNKDIVIKILRNGIKNKLEKGLNLLINLEKIIHIIPFIPNIFNAKIFEKNKINILNQINFTNESENLLLFYNNFKNSKYVVIPNVNLIFTQKNSNIILMDYIDGKYLYELDVNERDNYLNPFLKFVMNSIFKKYIFHCDLHQGNVLFIKEEKDNKIIYKVGIIDMGMVTKLTIDEVNFIYIWLKSIFGYTFLDLIDFIKKKENYFQIFENTKINTDINNDCMEYIANLYINQNIFYELNSDNFIKDIYLFMNILKKYNLILSPRYNFFLLSIIPIINISLKLGHSIDKKKSILEYFNKINNLNLLD